MALDEIQLRLLQEIADLHTVPEGAYNIRSNSALAGRNSTANIEIVSKADGTGIRYADQATGAGAKGNTTLYAQWTKKNR